MNHGRNSKHAVFPITCYKLPNQFWPGRSVQGTEPHSNSNKCIQYAFNYQVHYLVNVPSDWFFSRIGKQFYRTTAYIFRKSTQHPIYSEWFYPSAPNTELMKKIIIRILLSITDWTNDWMNFGLHKLSFCEDHCLFNCQLCLFPLVWVNIVSPICFLLNLLLFFFRHCSYHLLQIYSKAELCEVALKCFAIIPALMKSLKLYRHQSQVVLLIDCQVASIAIFPGMATALGL